MKTESENKKDKYREWAQENSLILNFLDKCSTISWPQGVCFYLCSSMFSVI